MTFLKYLLIQVFAYGIDMGTFLFLLHFDLAGPIIANIGSKLAAGSFAFVAHRRYTFNVAGSGFAGRQAVRYFIVLAANVPVASAMLVFILIWVPLPVVAKLLSDIVMVALSYVLSKKFIFNTQTILSSNSESRSKT
jgi:putative flippase GtrA